MALNGFKTALKSLSLVWNCRSTGSIFGKWAVYTALVMCHFMKILRLILYYISRISRSDFDLSMRIAHIGTNYVSILFLVTVYMLVAAG